MYSTCLHCHRPLGTNDAVEHFAVGRRLAFDSAKGRLWVICERCARWNLTPLQERWEAVEECERLFAASPMRASSDNVGLARLSDHMELVRIGRPERRELATWRYGGEFLERSARFVRRARWSDRLTWVSRIGFWGVLGPSAIGTEHWLLAVTGLMGVAVASETVRSRRTIVRARGDDGELLRIQRRHLELARIVVDESDIDRVALQVAHADGDATLRDARARRTLAAILTRYNWTGAEQRIVDRAVGHVDALGAPREYLRVAVDQARAPDRKRWWVAQNKFKEENRGRRGRRHLPVESTAPSWNLPDGSLRHLLPSQRLALEMAVHEDSEQRALVDGELAMLEAAWREAEEIAQIADGLLTPPDAEAFIERSRQRPDR